MRISDWSSDVCSSDLKRAFAGVGSGIGKRFEHPAAQPFELDDHPCQPMADHLELRDRPAELLALARVAGGFVERSQRGARRFAIVRESLRETGCTNVESSLHDGFVKKKVVIV